MGGKMNNARRSEQMSEPGSTGDTSNVKVSVGTGGKQPDSDAELPEPIQTLRSLVFDWTSDDIELRLRMVIADLRDGTAARERLPKDYYVEIIREIFESHQPQQDLERVKLEARIDEREGMQFFDDDGEETHKPYLQYRFTGNGLKQSWDDRTTELTAQLNQLKDKEGK